MVIDFLYGTAWKEDLTEDCVFRALKVGYRGIDTANQRKHYFEEGVGHALESAYSELGISRTDLFLQKKRRARKAIYFNGWWVERVGILIPCILTKKQSR